MKFQKVRRATAKAIVGLSLTLYAVNAFAISGMLQQFRCNEDPGPKQGEAQAQQRINWAWKCYPDKMEDYDFQKNAKDNMWDFPGQGRVIAYPVFGVKVNGNVSTIMQAPVDGNAPCDVLNKQAPDQKITIVGFCGVGCLTGDQVVEFGSGALAIGSDAAASEKSVVTLTEGSNLYNLAFQSTPLRQIVSDLEAKQQNVLQITTISGKSITVTLNHPLVDGDGLVRRADTLKVGESLVRASGQPEVIVSIEKNAIFGKVFNIRVESPKVEENIYVAQGYLSGSIGLQNEYVEYLNRKVLRAGDLLDITGL